MLFSEVNISNCCILTMESEEPLDPDAERCLVMTVWAVTDAEEVAVALEALDPLDLLFFSRLSRCEHKT